MKIFMPDMHLDFSYSIAKTLEILGYDLYVPDQTFNRYIRYGLKFLKDGYDANTAYYDFPALRNRAVEFTSLKNVKVVSYEELLSEQIDVYISPCSQQDVDMYNLFHTHKPRCPRLRLCNWSGNNSDIHKYQFGKMQNIFTGDIGNYNIAKSSGKNCLYFFPFIDYSRYSHSEHNSIFIRNYIIKQSQYWKEGWEISNVIKNAMSNAGMNDYVEFDLEPDWRKPPNDNIAELMKDSMATIHIKAKEGFGYAICHSLASGRPLIMYNKYKSNKTYNNWCIDNETSIFFDKYEDLFIKLTRYIFDIDLRKTMQENASKKIRELINNTEQAEAMGKFLQELR